MIAFISSSSNINVFGAFSSCIFVVCSENCCSFSFTFQRRMLANVDTPVMPVKIDNGP